MRWANRRQADTEVSPQAVLTEFVWRRYGSTMTAEQQERANTTNRILADFLADLLAGAAEETAVEESLRTSGMPDAVDRLARLKSGEIVVAVTVTYEPIVNVVVRPVEGHYLIAMTEQFVWLVEHFGWLVAATGTYSDGDRIIEPALSYETARARFASWMDQVLRGDRPPHPLEKLEPAVVERSLHYFKNAMQFALGHEIGHVILGHFDGPTPAQEDIALRAPKGAFTRVEELTADQVGARLVSQRFEGEVESQFFGMIVMFELLDAVEMHAIAQQDPAAQPISRRARALATHPHPAIRRNTAIRTASSGVELPSLPVCDALLSQCEQIRGQGVPQHNNEAIELLNLVGRHQA